jgi:hypothetical protein
VVRFFLPPSSRLFDPERLPLHHRPDLRRQRVLSLGVEEKGPHGEVRLEIEAQIGFVGEAKLEGRVVKLKKELELLDGLALGLGKRGNPRRIDVDVDRTLRSLGLPYGTSSAPWSGRTLVSEWHTPLFRRF